MRGKAAIVDFITAYSKKYIILRMIIPQLFYPMYMNIVFYYRKKFETEMT